MDVVQRPTLTALDEALANNLDLRAAITRIDLARAQVKLAQKDLYPTVDLGVGASRTRSSEVGSFPLFGAPATNNDFRVELNASYEVDLWSKFRTATRAAQDDLLASRYGRRCPRSSRRMWPARFRFAADALLDVSATRSRRNETVARSATATGAASSAITIWRGGSRARAVASDIAVAKRAVAQPVGARGPAGRRRASLNLGLRVSRSRLAACRFPPVLPSDMLLRRPDMGGVSACGGNRRIDVARADYFPSLSLTGGYGSESSALKNLFTGPAVIWTLAASLAQPLIGLKAIEANVESKTATRDQLVVTYQQTVQTAFKETHDALVANQTTRDALAAQTERRTNLERALDLAGLRYRSGYSPTRGARCAAPAPAVQSCKSSPTRLCGHRSRKAMGGGWEYKAERRGRMNWPTKPMPS